MDNNETHLTCDKEQTYQDLGSELEKCGYSWVMKIKDEEKTRRLEIAEQKTKEFRMVEWKRKELTKLKESTGKGLEIAEIKHNLWRFYRDESGQLIKSKLKKSKGENKGNIPEGWNMNKYLV